MAQPLVTDDLWEIIEPLLPPPLPRRRNRNRRGGRPPLDDRKVLTGVVFVLKTGLPWESLPRELGCGCGMTCWRRLRDWHRAGVWRNLHRVLLDRLNAADKIDWSRAVVDSTSVRAMHGGKKRGRALLTAEKQGLSTTCWWMARAGRRWRSRSRKQTATT
jgi:transposase